MSDYKSCKACQMRFLVHCPHLTSEDARLANLSIMSAGIDAMPSLQDSTPEHLHVAHFFPKELRYP